MHDMGIVHLDIKPENVCLELSDFTDHRSSFLHLIDFGISRRYLDDDGIHVDQKPVGNFEGSLLFASRTAFEKTNQSRRDDLITMVYMLIYFLKGTLPWYFGR